MKGLPGGPGAPVRVEAGGAAVGHDDQQVKISRPFLDTGGAGPGFVRVAAAVQEVQHRPTLAFGGLELAGRSSRTFTSRPTGGESIVRSQMRPLTCSLATIRGGCASGVAEAGSSGSRVGASVATQPASRVKITSASASHQGRREALAITAHIMSVSTYR